MTAPESLKPHLFVLTGAGISAESGIPTFRDNDGLWCTYDVHKLASPRGFHQAPNLVLDFYQERIDKIRSVSPNAAHQALVELQDKWPGKFTLVTTNVDDLHERAGSIEVLHMHGEIDKVRCLGCHAIHPLGAKRFRKVSCRNCGATSGLRPDVVWFTEMPKYLDAIHEALDTCDILLIVGSSLAVAPSSRFPAMAWKNNQWGHREGLPPCRIIEVNPRPSGHMAIAETYASSATEALPGLVESLLSDR